LSKSVKPPPRYGDFSSFQDGGRRHFGFLKFGTFNGPTTQERRTASPCKISLTLLKTRPRYSDFTIFQDGGRRYVGFFKFQIFKGSSGSRGPNCVAVPNLVKIGHIALETWRFFDFSRWRPPPFWIVKIWNF